MSIKKKGSESNNALDMKQMIYELGKTIGLIADTEVSKYATNIRFEKEYQPEVDVVWYLNLSDDINASKIQNLLVDLDLFYLTFLPLVGFEVEATDPTSKTQISNAANLYVQHYPYGFLVIDENKGDKDLYRRAGRILRTFRFQFGHIDYLPLSKSQLNYLLNFQWKSDLKEKIKFEESLYSKGTGGESEKSKVIRKKVVDIGIKAGFKIMSDWSPEDLILEYTLRKNIFNKLDVSDQKDLEIKRFLCKELSWTPNECKSISKWNQFYIKPKIDVIWCIGLPKRFVEFIEVVNNLDYDFKYNLPIFRNPKNPYPVVGFEIESQINKHAGGGILNLSRYTHYGFLVTEMKKIDSLKRKIKTYSRNLGINNVYPLSFEEIERCFRQDLLQGI